MEDKTKEKLITLIQGREKLAELLGNESVEKVNLGKLKYTGVSEGRNVFDVEGERIEADEVGLRDLLSFSNVPAPFFNRCDDTLKDNIVKRFIASEDKVVKSILINDKTMTGVVSIETPYMNAVKIYDLVTEVIPEDALLQAQVNADRSWYWNFVTEDMANPPKDVNDITKGGISIEYKTPQRKYGGGDTFMPRYNVGGFLYRLVCTNGLITRTNEMETVKGNKEDDMIFEIKRLTALALKSVKEHDLKEFVRTAGVTIDDPSGWINRLAKEGKIKGALRDKLMDRVPSLAKPTTQYDLINLITSTANEQPFTSRRKLQQVAGTSLVANCRCPQCHSSLNGK